MTNWRDQILKEFAPKVARLTIVADPDGLLLEEGILEGIHERGFELIPFDDHIAFRYAYETRFRSRWDKGEHTDLVVVLRTPASDLSHLPYDLLQAGRRLSFSLGDIFSNLSYPIVTELDRGNLDALYEAQRRHAPGMLGDNATKEFILRHVFEIAPELIKQVSDLLRVLLRIHYRGQRLPRILNERFITLLKQSNLFNDWPLEILVSDRETFFAFLQERWPVFLDHEASKETAKIREEQDAYGIKYDGPLDLPFDHHDIRVYIDNLFVEGFLQPVSHEQAEILSKSWIGIGIQTQTQKDDSRRLQKLIDSLASSIPTDVARHTDWLHFARGWAELVLLYHRESSDNLYKNHAEVSQLEGKIDIAFSAWLLKRYAGLINLPPSPPVMLHHLPRFLSHQIKDGNKIALVVIDGLSLDQWLVIRSTLTTQLANYRYRENTVFAWVPSLTSISRQAMFAGKAPLYFPNSINSTDKESALWTQFWSDQGLAPNEVVYLKNLGNTGLETLSEMISHPKVKVAGLVVDKVDRIMHGMEMGTAGMHNQVDQWVKQQSLCKLIDLLAEKGFRVYLTSDHGNIEAEGCGRPSEGATADLRGERVRVYPDPSLRCNVKDCFPEAMEWSTIGLPEDYLPLLAPHRKAFVQEKQKTVCHGGIAIEELIVPFIQIEKEPNEQQ